MLAVIAYAEMWLNRDMQLEQRQNKQSVETSNRNHAVILPLMCWAACKPSCSCHLGQRQIACATIAVAITTLALRIQVAA